MWKKVAFIGIDEQRDRQSEGRQMNKKSQRELNSILLDNFDISPALPG